MRKSTLRHAGIGAAAMIATGLVPLVGVFAPLVGGGVAGWLGAEDDANGAKLGAVAGAIASLLFVPLVLLGAAIAVFDAGITLFVFLAVAVVGTALLTGLGALGGTVGSALADDRESDADERVGSTNTEADPVDRAQRRYTSGELTESELESELDRVLDAGPRDEEVTEEEAVDRYRERERSPER